MHYLYYYICSVFMALTACQSSPNTIVDAADININNAQLRDGEELKFQAKNIEQEFTLPQGIEIQLTTLQLTNGSQKVRDNINQYLQDFAIQAFNFTSTSAQEAAHFYSFKEVLQANLQLYKNYTENHSDGWVDVWHIYQLYTLVYQNDKLLIVEFANTYSWGETIINKPEKITLYFDTQTGKNLNIQDLFIDSIQSLNTIKAELAKAMLAIKDNTTQIQNSLSPINFPSYFTIQENNIHCIYFQQDGLEEEFGTVFVDIPLETFKNHMKCFN